MKLTFADWYQINKTRETFISFLKEKEFKGWPNTHVDWDRKIVFLVKESS